MVLYCNVMYMYILCVYCVGGALITSLQRHLWNRWPSCKFTLHTLTHSHTHTHTHTHTPHTDIPPTHTRASMPSISPHPHLLFHMH